MLRVLSAITKSFRPHDVSRIGSASKRNEYHEYLRVGVGGGVRWPVCKAANLVAIMCQLSKNSEIISLLQPSWPVQSCVGIALGLL